MSDIITRTLGKLDTPTMTLAFATAVGAWGGYPQPPDVVKSLFSSELFQYFAVFVLVWQGGANQDLGVAVAGTAMLYGVFKALEAAKHTQLAMQLEAQDAARQADQARAAIESKKAKQVAQATMAAATHLN